MRRQQILAWPGWIEAPAFVLVPAWIGWAGPTGPSPPDQGRAVHRCLDGQAGVPGVDVLVTPEAAAIGGDAPLQAMAEPVAGGLIPGGHALFFSDDERLLELRRAASPSPAG